MFQVRFSGDDSLCTTLMVRRNLEGTTMSRHWCFCATESGRIERLLSSCMYITDRVIWMGSLHRFTAASKQLWATLRAWRSDSNHIRRGLFQLLYNIIVTAVTRWLLVCWIRLNTIPICRFDINGAGASCQILHRWSPSWCSGYVFVI